MVVGKVCKKCLVWKEFGEFLKHPNCKTDGHKGTCKECEKIYRKEYAKKNKEKLSIKNKEKHERMKNDPHYIKVRKDYLERNKAAKSEYDKKYNAENKEKISEYRKKYSEENKELLSAKSKAWREKNEDHLKKYRKANKERRTEFNKKYWAENKESQKERINEWRKENSERIKMYRVANRDRDREKAREWGNTERGKMLRTTTTNRYRARKRKLKNDFTAHLWKECVKHFEESCAYCGAKEKLEQEHFVPVTKGGGLTKGNIVPACRNCNVTKSNRDFGEWYKSQKHYSPEREKKILLYLGKEVSDDSLQVLAHRNRKDTQNINDSNR